MATTTASPIANIGHQVLNAAVTAGAAQLPTLVTTGVQTLTDLIAGLVHHQAPVAQATNGPGTGPIKLGDVVLSVQKSLVSAHAAGTLTGTIPDGPTILLIVQSMISIMKLPGGQLVAPTPPVAVTSGDVVLPSGSKVTITVP